MYNSTILHIQVAVKMYHAHVIKIDSKVIEYDEYRINEICIMHLSSKLTIKNIEQGESGMERNMNVQFLFCLTWPWPTLNLACCSSFLCRDSFRQRPWTTPPPLIFFQSGVRPLLLSPKGFHFVVACPFLPTPYLCATLGCIASFWLLVANHPTRKQWMNTISQYRISVHYRTEILSIWRKTPNLNQSSYTGD